MGRLIVRVKSASGLVQATSPCIGLRLWKDAVPSEDEWVFTTSQFGVNPTFGEKFKFEIPVGGDPSLEIAAYDQPSFGGKRIFLGQNLIYLAEIEADMPLPFEMVLMGAANAGGVQPKVSLELFKSTESRNSTPAPIPVAAAAPAPVAATRPRAVSDALPRKTDVIGTISAAGAQYPPAATRTSATRPRLEQSYLSREHEQKFPATAQIRPHQQQPQPQLRPAFNGRYTYGIAPVPAPLPARSGVDQKFGLTPRGIARHQELSQLMQANRRFELPPQRQLGASTQMWAGIGPTPIPISAATMAPPARYVPQQDAQERLYGRISGGGNVGRNPRGAEPPTAYARAPDALVAVSTPFGFSLAAPSEESVLRDKKPPVAANPYYNYPSAATAPAPVRPNTGGWRWGLPPTAALPAPTYPESPRRYVTTPPPIPEYSTSSAYPPAAYPAPLPMLPDPYNPPVAGRPNDRSSYPESRMQRHLSGEEPPRIRTTSLTKRADGLRPPSADTLGSSNQSQLEDRYGRVLPTRTAHATNHNPPSRPSAGEFDDFAPAPLPRLDSRPLQISLKVVSAKDNELLRSSQRTYGARETFTRLRLGAWTADTVPTRNLGTAIFDEQFLVDLPDDPQCVLFVEVIHNTIPKQVAGRCRCDVGLLPWTTDRVHRCSIPFQDGNGSIQLIIADNDQARERRAMSPVQELMRRSQSPMPPLATATSSSSAFKTIEKPRPRPMYDRGDRPRIAWPGPQASEANAITESTPSEDLGMERNHRWSSYQDPQQPQQQQQPRNYGHSGTVGGRVIDTSVGNSPVDAYGRSITPPPPLPAPSDMPSTSTTATRKEKTFRRRPGAANPNNEVIPILPSPQRPSKTHHHKPQPVYPQQEPSPTPVHSTYPQPSTALATPAPLPPSSLPAPVAPTPIQAWQPTNPTPTSIALATTAAPPPQSVPSGPSPSSGNSTEILEVSHVEVRFTRGPKTFFKSSGDIHCRLSVPVPGRKSRVFADTDHQPKAPNIKWDEELRLSLKGLPATVHFHLMCAVYPHDDVIAEGEFTVPASAPGNWASVQVELRPPQNATDQTLAATAEIYYTM